MKAVNKIAQIIRIWLCDKPDLQKESSYLNVSGEIVHQMRFDARLNERTLDEVSNTYCELTNGKFSNPETDKVYIIEAVNTISDNEVKEALSANNEKWRKKVSPYLRHDELCGVSRQNRINAALNGENLGSKCTCGLDELLSGKGVNNEGA